MPTYRRSNRPDETPEAIVEYLDDELQKVQESLEYATEVRLEELNREPARPRTGMLVLADGTNWDPGSGAGFYGYRNGAWQLLG